MIIVPKECWMPLELHFESWGQELVVFCLGAIGIYQSLMAQFVLSGISFFNSSLHPQVYLDIIGSKHIFFVPGTGVPF